VKSESEKPGPGQASSPVPPSSRLECVGRFILGHWRGISALSWLLSAALYVTLPPSPDQFQHSYLGWRFLEGDAPYHDFIDMNFPGVVFLHALGSLVFGNHLWSWRAFDFLLFAASSLFLVDLVRMAAGGNAGKIMFLLCPLIYVGSDFWVCGQQDMSAAQFLLGALWFHVRGYQAQNWRWQIGTGFFLGLAVLNKPTVGILGLLLPVQAAWLRVPLRRVLLHTAVAGGASVASGLAAIGVLMVRGTTFGEIVDCLYTYNVFTQFADSMSVQELALRAGIVHLRWWGTLTVAGIVFCAWALRPANRRLDTTAFLLLWAVGLFSYFFQRRGFGYHLSPCLAALWGGMVIPLALAGEGRLFPNKSHWNRCAAVGLCLLALFGIGYKLGRSYHTLVQAAIRRDYSLRLSDYIVHDQTTLAEGRDIARQFEQLPPDEPLFIAGSATAINYLAKRRQPTRFYLIPIVTACHPPLPMADRWISLWSEDLRKTRCHYCLLARTISEDWLRKGSPGATALLEFLEQYRLTGTLGEAQGLMVYERK
jgi:hypothetical protein